MEITHDVRFLVAIPVAAVVALLFWVSHHFGVSMSVPCILSGVVLLVYAFFCILVSSMNVG